jgi:hypothetical protein
MLAACAAEPPSAPSPVAPAPASTGLDAVVEAAITDAATRSGVGRDGIRLISAEAVTWGDGALGCPEPGMMYTQALVPGYRVRLEAGGRVLDYHSSLRGPPNLCPPGRSQEPLRDGPAISAT